MTEPSKEALEAAEAFCESIYDAYGPIPIPAVARALDTFAAQRVAEADDPEMDATDYAHPAWWRGDDHGVMAAVRRLNDVLDGKDDGNGVIGYEPLETLRRRLMQHAQAGWDAAIKALRQVDDTDIHLHTDYSLAADYLEANKPKQERIQQKSKLLVDLPDDELQIEWRHWNSVITEATGWGASLAAANEFRRDCEHELRRRGLPTDWLVDAIRALQPEEPKS